jgi:hypothetical protein
LKNEENIDEISGELLVENLGKFMEIWNHQISAPSSPA